MIPPGISKEYLSLTIHARINFKAYWLNPFGKMWAVFNECEHGPKYYCDSPFPAGWGVAFETRDACIRRGGNPKNLSLS